MAAVVVATRLENINKLDKAKYCLCSGDSSADDLHFLSWWFGERNIFSDLIVDVGLGWNCCDGAASLGDVTWFGEVT